MGWKHQGGLLGGVLKDQGKWAWKVPEAPFLECWESKVQGYWEAGGEIRKVSWSQTQEGLFPLRRVTLTLKFAEALTQWPTPIAPMKRKKTAGHCVHKKTEVWPDAAAWEWREGNAKSYYRGRNRLGVRHCGREAAGRSCECLWVRDHSVNIFKTENENAHLQAGPRRQ